jgi:prophage tail gpP-like protein
MFLNDGQSEIDSVSMFVRGLDLEIKTWQSYSIRHDFLTPSAAFDFAFSTNSPLAYNEVFVEGAEVQIFVEGCEQMTGTIEKVSKSANREGGLIYKISGRDFLGPVVSASIDPKIRISANQTVFDFLTLVLSPYDIGKIYIGDEINYSIVTGYVKGKGRSQTKTFQVKEAQSRKEKDAKTATVVYNTKTVTQVVSQDRPDLKKIPLDQLKPKIGDGAMQVIERLLSRLGLQMFAAADGSGVIVDKPDFITPPIHRLVRRFNGDAENNIEDGESLIDAESQPCYVLAVGQSSGSDMAKIRLKAIAVNELVAVNPDGSFAPYVQDVIARYPGIKILPLRNRLIPSTNRIVSRRKPVPIILKDDESKSIDQISAFARRKLSEYQRRFLTANYVVKGHTYGDAYPYAINTNIDVDDDFLDIHETLWCVGRTFTKSRDAGTKTELVLIRPYTLELGQ